MEKKKVGAYWDFYDSNTSKLLEKERLIEHNAMPGVGDVVIGIPGRPQVIVKDFRFRGIKDNLPCYDVFV